MNREIKSATNEELHNYFNFMGEFWKFIKGSWNYIPPEVGEDIASDYLSSILIQGHKRLKTKEGTDLEQEFKSNMLIAYTNFLKRKYFTEHREYLENK